MAIAKTKFIAPKCAVCLITPPKNNSILVMVVLVLPVICIDKNMLLLMLYWKLESIEHTIPKDAKEKGRRFMGLLLLVRWVHTPALCDYYLHRSTCMHTYE